MTQIKKLNKKQNRVLHGLNLCWQNITVEPILLLFFLPFSISSLSIQNLNLEKACRVNLNLTNSICDALQHRNYSGYNESDQILVQREVASSYIWKNVIFGIFPTILLPLLGSWSDRNNVRKALMLIPITGQILANTGFILSTYFFYKISLEITVAIEAFAFALTGGFHVILLGIYTYIAVISTQENKTFRLGVVFMLLSTSNTIGTMLSGIIYNAVGLYGVFSICLTMYILAGIYTIFYVNEVKNDNEKLQTKLKLVKDIVNVKQTFNTFRSLFKPHQNNRRTQIIVVVILGTLDFGPIMGEVAVLYLYTKFKFNWNEIEYSLFLSYYNVLPVIGCIIALALFSKYLSLNDALLGVISGISKIMGGVVYTLAKIPALFYVGTLLQIFNGAGYIASRSIIAKLVLQEELGKVNSLIGIAESLTALIYGSIYSAVYNAFLAKFPSAFYLVGITLTIPGTLMYLWLYKHRHIRESPLNCKDDKNESFLEECNSIDMDRYYKITNRLT